MSLGKQIVELLHAPRWQLTLANRPAGEAIRVLAWLGPEKAAAAAQTLKRKLVRQNLANWRPQPPNSRLGLPSW
jgi:hypothetical protein